MSLPTPFDLARRKSGAVLYTAGAPIEALLTGFARELRARGWRVGGLVQRTQRDAAGRKTEMELIEIDTGRRQSIAQVLGKGAGGDGCTVNAAAVADSTSALRRAVSEHVDLMVVNKYSHLERQGGGLIDEMVSAMVEDLPLLTALPAALLDDWMTLTGGRTELLAPEARALWRWWGPHRLYEDLVRGVGGDDPAERVVIGYNWIMVQGPHGAGLAHCPPRDAPGCRTHGTAGHFSGRPLAELARLVGSWNPFEVAVGMAAINAHYNRFDLAGGTDNGLDAFAGETGRVTVVGGFPGIEQRLPGCSVIERSPGPGQFPEAAAEWLLPISDAVVLTASAAGNLSLPRLLELAWDARVAVVGPSTTLSPRLMTYGVEVLSGLVVVDADGLARVVGEGGGVRAVKDHTRPVTLRA